LITISILLRRLREKHLLDRARRALVRLWIALMERDPPATPLIAAARRGDLAAVESMLTAGAPVDALGRHGRTALHDAVLRGHAAVAALLLAHGANPAITDRHGRPAFGLEPAGPERLHVVRQHYHRLRQPVGGASASETAAAWASALERNGIVKVTGLIGADELACMQADCQAFVTSLEDRLARGEGVYRYYDEEEHYWADDRAYVSNNAFKHSSQFVRFCGQEDLAAAASLYLGKPAFIQRAVAMRYLPNRDTRNDMFGWHHDMDEKRFKVMVLLSDVGASDQHMSYVLGSQKLFHPYRMFFRNECSLDYCRKHMGAIEIYDATGKAGDVFIFDSNGAHRGNRRESGNIRDVFLVEFTADKSEVWGADIDPTVLAELSFSGVNPFERLLAVEHKKWEAPSTRSAPAWVENLPHVERWLDLHRERVTA
jgi:hypothetical protein